VIALPEIALEHLKASGINAALAADAGITFVTRTFGLGKKQESIRCLRYAYFDIYGKDTGYYRDRLLDEWIPPGKGEPRKYSQRPDTLPHPYFAKVGDWPAVANDPRKPLYITEAEKNALLACNFGFPTIGLGGVDGYHSKKKGISFLAELAAINWKGRIVYVLFDNDSKSTAQRNVRRATATLVKELQDRGAIVRVVKLPRENGQDKAALDDYLVAHGKKGLIKLLGTTITNGSDVDSPPADLWVSADIALPLRRALLPKTLDAFAFNSPQTLDSTALGFSLIAGCAMAASDNVRLKINDTWHERVCLWIGLYGDSGVGKSPVVKAATRPLEAISATQSETYAATRAHWEATKLANNNVAVEPEPHRPPRLISHDVNSAAASEILKSTNHGFGILNDEISTVLASLDSARDNKGSADRGPMLKLYDGGRYEMDRIQRGVVVCANWSASILGGITTALLASIATASIADGMLARFMLVQVQKLPPSDSLDSGDTDVYLAYKNLIRMLVDHRPNDHVDVELEPGARTLLGAAKMKWQQLANDAANALPRYTERVNKLPGQAARLALLLMMVEVCEHPKQSKIDRPGTFTPHWTDITEAQMRRAIALLDLQLGHDLVFYRGQLKMDVGPEMILARKIASWILRDKIKSFNQRALTTLDAWNRRSDQNTKRDALVLLQELNWAQPSDEPWYGYGATLVKGIEWTVDARVHAAFGARAELARREAAAIKETIAASAKARREQRGTE
jgi:hypothetical protein